MTLTTGGLHQQLRNPAAASKPLQDFLAAIGLVFVVEGLIYGGFPKLARRLASEVLAMPEGALRVAGLSSIAIGVAVVWLVRG